jgi:hypothetical protein
MQPFQLTCRQLHHHALGLGLTLNGCGTINTASGQGDNGAGTSGKGSSSGDGSSSPPVGGDDPTNLANLAKELLKDQEAARGGVYTLRDDAGNVIRTGGSSNLAVRQLAHANDPALGKFEFQVEYRTDVYAEQRGLEQMLFDQYPEAQAANGCYNTIRGISPLNPRGPGYMSAAHDYLQKLRGGG